MKNLKDVLEQWKPKPGARPIESDSEEPTTAIDRIRDGLNLGDNDGEDNNPLEPQTGIDFSVLPRRGQDDDLHLSTPRTGSDFTENKDYNGPLKSDLTDAVTQAKTVTGGLGDKISKVIGVLDTPEGEKIKLAGMLSDNKTPHYFDVKKNDQGEWGWYNDEENKWEPFKEY